jgi:carbon storage regulator
MLVLSRKERERIRLGDSIVLTVVQVSGDRVRIGVEAPADVLILRDELETHVAARESRPALEESTVRTAATRGG